MSNELRHVQQRLTQVTGEKQAMMADLQHARESHSMVAQEMLMKDQ